MGDHSKHTQTHVAILAPGIWSSSCNPPHITVVYVHSAGKLRRYLPFGSITYTAPPRPGVRSYAMKFSRTVSILLRAAVLFLLVCIGLLFTAAAIELRHAPQPDPGDEQSLRVAHLPSRG